MQMQLTAHTVNQFKFSVSELVEILEESIRESTEDYLSSWQIWDIVEDYFFELSQAKQNLLLNEAGLMILKQRLHDLFIKFIA